MISYNRCDGRWPSGLRSKINSHWLLSSAGNECIINEFVRLTLNHHGNFHLTDRILSYLKAETKPIGGGSTYDYADFWKLWKMMDEAVEKYNQYLKKAKRDEIVEAGKDYDV